MNSLLIKIGLAVLLAWTTLAASAQQLLDRARVGMTLNEVKKLYPKAKATRNPSPFVNGAKALLEVSEVAFEGKAYRLELVFLEEKLYQLHFVRDLQVPVAQAEGEHAELAKRFTRRYGAPTETDAKRSSKSSLLSGAWERDGVAISVLSSWVLTPDGAQAWGSIVVNFKPQKK
jgi:hypothetical protein